MRIRVVCALALWIGLSPVCQAQSVFDGLWRPDPQVFSPTRKPDIVGLAQGIYDCQSCTPPYKVTADGHDQALSGNPNYDTLSITVVDDRTVLKVGKKGGKTIAETKATVDANGNVKEEVQTLYNMAPRPIEMTIHSVRVSDRPKDSHLISGTWRMTNLDVSNHAEDTIFNIHDGTLSMSDRLGRSFSAKLDGTESPYDGSEEFTHVSVKLIDSHTIEELDKRRQGDENQPLVRGAGR